MMANKNGTMTLSSITAVALWHQEVCGQISDGMWENSRPHNHWNFWSGLNVELGQEAKVTSDDRCSKNSYALLRLAQVKFDDGTYILRDRMLAIARLALAANSDYQSILGAAQYMPASFLEWSREKAANSWKYEFIADYMANVSPDLAARFYATTYTPKELRRDLTLIQNAMKTAKTL